MVEVFKLNSNKDIDLDMSIKLERRRLFQYLYNGIEELYQPISLNTVTNDTFKAFMNGGGIHIELF